MMAAVRTGIGLPFCSAKIISQLYLYIHIALKLTMAADRIGQTQTIQHHKF